MANMCKNCRYLDLRDSEYYGWLSGTKYYCRKMNTYVGENECCEEFEGVPPRTYVSEGCYLTTACVQFYNLPDNCYELETLRKFRDEYMNSTDEGKSLVDDYYKTAPKIVEKINSLNNKSEYYEFIYQTIKRCVKLIELKDYATVQNIYKEMTEKLASELL